MNEPPDVVSRYFVLDAQRDVEAIVALFSVDPTVVDEGEARRGHGGNPRMAARGCLEV